MEGDKCNSILIRDSIKISYMKPVHLSYFVNLTYRHGSVHRNSRTEDTFRGSDVTEGLQDH